MQGSSQPLSPASELFGDKPKDDTDYAGTEIRISYGKEHIQPFRFQGFDVGPFEIGVVVKEGETPLEAKRRGMKILVEMAEEEYREKLPRFQQRVRESGDLS